MSKFALVAAALLVSAPVLGQSIPSEVAVPARAAISGTSDADRAAERTDALPDNETARRVALLYDRYADLLRAAADGHDTRYASLLEGLVGDLQILGQREGVAYDPRYRELYASVLTEKELFYGVEAIDRGDVYAVNDEAFRLIYDTDDPTLDSVVLPELNLAAVAFETAIPMEVTPSVERSLRFLLRRPGHVATLRQRADTYFPMVERILAEEGVPDELKYLAMVESALNPVARSHMAAAGMWQFIRATGGAYGLEVNREVDLRLDPELSTRAAARHLRDLYDRFGDWQLALAGYNCNPAVIARAVRRHESRTGERATFWDIDHAIPRETRGYVPMFIATSLILSTPDAYGFEAPEPGPAYVFDRVPVAPGTRLSAVAQAIDVDEAVLRALNPMLRRGRVPGTRMPHTVRIPYGFYAPNALRLDALAGPQAGSLVAETVDFGRRAVRPLAPVEPADILIAAREDAEREARAERRELPPLASASAPRRAVTPPSTPVSRPAAPEPVAAQPAPEPAAEPAAAPEAEPVAAEVAEPVRVAEAPRAVAASPAATEPEPLAAAEEVAPDAADLAPTPAVAEAAPAAPEAEPAAPSPAVADAQPTSQPEPTPEPQPQAAPEAPPVRLAADAGRATVHRVRRGEHLSMIARRYGVSVRDLQGWNGLSGGTIYPGQRLRLIAPEGYTPRRAASSRSRTVTHRVSRGENLTQIARRYGVSLSDIRRWNSLSRDTIVPGQRLKIERPRRGVRG